MRYARQFLAVTLIVLMAVSSAVAGDQHVVSPQQLAATVSQQVAQQDADRAAVREALARPEVRDFAKKMNVDMNRVDAIASTLSGVDLAQAAQAARQVNGQLVGGASTVVISTTTIIIILLLIILLVVAIK
jgi:predicted outer membrane protein